MVLVALIRWYCGLDTMVLVALIRWPCGLDTCDGPCGFATMVLVTLIRWSLWTCYDVRRWSQFEAEDLGAYPRE